MWMPSLDDNVLNDDDREDLGELRESDMQMGSPLKGSVNQMIAYKGLEGKPVSGKIIGFSKNEGRWVFVEVYPGYYGILDVIANGSRIIDIN